MRRGKVSEAGTLRAIIDYLEPQMALGNLVYTREHPVKMFTDKSGHIRFAKLRESQLGRPDIFVFQPVESAMARSAGYFTSGIIKMIAIETKSRTGKQREYQKRWQAKFEAIGGLYLLCRSVDEFLERVK